MTEVRDLEDTRKEIDEIDARLLELFCRRMELAADVAAYKNRHGLPTLRPEREKEILERTGEKAGPVFSPYARRFFEGVMGLSREYQEALRNTEESE